MSSIPEDEQRIAELLLPLAGNTITATGEVLVTVNPQELIQAIRQYAAKERLDELEHVAGLWYSESGEDRGRSGPPIDVSERIKQLKEGL